MLIFSACLIGSVWCLRYAVGYFGILFPNLSTIAPNSSSFEGLTWWEEIFNSTVHALQTFSMDEDYTAYIISGKTMIREMFGAESTWQTVYGSYAAVLNLVAPIAGGAVIFEILASVFPKIKLNLSHFAIWKEKYYFSELNDASLALAKSIIATNPTSLKRPVIIFTDAYIDDEDEKGSEMLLEAKAIGAVCVRDDLSHVRKNRFGTRKFFLIDEKESGNLQTLTSLANSNNSEFIKNSEIYLFTNDDAYVQVERCIREKLMDEWKLDDDADELPSIIPVQSYRNLISNLLVDIPLFEPLISKKDKCNQTLNLTVSILGTGHIGTEMFLSTYWFGQILNCNLHINVLSQETEEQFWSKIDYINPEIKHTTIDGDDILIFNDNGDKSPVYCNVRYYQCDVKSSKFIEKLKYDNDSILGSDYFLVSLGSDEDNISVANTVKRFVGNHHIETANKNLKENMMITSPDKVVIAYVVYDSELSQSLNRKKQYRYVDDSVDVYMRAVGSLREVYSVQNVFMTKHEASAQSAHDAYTAIQNREARAKAHKKRVKDDYKHWATLAQSMHELYRVFASGETLPSKLEVEDDEDKIKNDEKIAKTYEDYLTAIERAKNNFKHMVSGQDRWPDDFKRIELLHNLAWMEHRRWNAFTRIKGFRHTDAYDAYAVTGATGSYKQMDTKLHPCLVECDNNGIRVLSDSNRNIGIGPIFLRSDDAEMDFLDRLSYDLRDKEYNDYDFKLYDYPMVEQTILDDIDLPNDFMEAAKQTAKILHEEWRQKRLASGWKYGKEFDAERKLDHRITEFEKLSGRDLEDAMYAPVTQYKIAFALGYKIKSE